MYVHSYELLYRMFVILYIKLTQNCVLAIGLKESHTYANIDTSPRLRQSGILETSE